MLATLGRLMRLPDRVKHSTRGSGNAVTLSSSVGANPATTGGGGGLGGGGLRPCRATVPPHRVCRVTRGRRYVVLCEGDRHLCHLCRLCRLCHVDTEGGGGDHWKVCRGTCRDMGKLRHLYFLSPPISHGSQNVLPLRLIRLRIYAYLLYLSWTSPGTSKLGSHASNRQTPDFRSLI